MKFNVVILTKATTGRGKPKVCKDVIEAPCSEDAMRWAVLQGMRYEARGRESIVQKVKEVS